MNIQTFQQPSQTKAVADFLVQVRHQGTPLRVDSDTETYYVLTATQLQHLLEAAIVDNMATDLPNDHAFSLDDFGLTEADVVAYEAEQERQRSALNRHQQRPLHPALIRRLNALPRLEALFPMHAVAEREALLRELETAMLHNLCTLIPEAE
jgi:hypothetical protein